MAILKNHSGPVISPLIGMTVFFVPAVLLKPMAGDAYTFLYFILLMVCTGLLGWLNGADLVRVGVMAMLVPEIILPAAILASAWSPLGNLSLILEVGTVLRGPYFAFLFYNGILTTMMFGLVLRGRRAFGVFAGSALLIHGLIVIASLHWNQNSSIVMNANPFYLLLPIGGSMGLGVGLFDRFFQKTEISSN